MAALQDLMPKDTDDGLGARLLEELARLRQELGVMAHRQEVLEFAQQEWQRMLHMMNGVCTRVRVHDGVHLGAQREGWFSWRMRVHSGVH